MTQTNRWLAALALLLAFGAYGVRAEEEEVPPSPHSVIELLPSPTPAPTDLPCVRILAPGMPAGWPLFFSAGCPCSCPYSCPAPIAAAAYTVPGGPAGEVNAAVNLLNVSAATEYVVSAKMVKAGADGDFEEVMCPRVSVAEGQTATIQVHGVETPREHRNLGMQFRIMKQDKGAQLDLSVEDVTAFDGGESNRRMKTEATQSECNVTLGKPTKVELKHDADGAATAWVEVTVTEVEREERLPRTACGSCQGGSCPSSKPCAKDDSDESAMDCVGEIIDGVCDTIADTATGLFSRPTWVEEMTLPSAHYMENPPQYVSPSPVPLPRELAAQAATAAPCPTGCCTCSSGCAPCAYIVAAKAPTMRIRIDAATGRMCLEKGEGDKHWKAEADRLTLKDGRLLLEGNIRAELVGGEAVMEAETIELKLEKDLNIKIGD